AARRSSLALPGWNDRVWGAEAGTQLGRVTAQDLGQSGRVVEADERVRDDEPALGKVRAVGGQRHRRLERRRMVVREETHDRRVCPLRLLEPDEARSGADEGVPAEPPVL